MPSTGLHRLEIAAENRGAPVGAYQVFFAEARDGDPADAAQAAAEAARSAAAAWRAASGVPAESVADALAAAAEGLALSAAAGRR